MLSAGKKTNSFPNPFVFCSAPGPPSRVRFLSVNRTSVTIAWDPPVYPRGVITRYGVAYRFNLTSSAFIWQGVLGRNERQRTVGALNAQSFYRFFVWAGTNTSWSNSPAEAVVYTGGSTGKYRSHVNFNFDRKVLQEDLYVPATCFRKIFL